MGFLTSATEISVAFASFANKEVEVSTGNLLGGIIVLFLFLIPLLSILFNGIRLTHTMSKPAFLLNVLALMIPGIVFVDGTLTIIESLVLLGAGGFVYFLMIFSKREKFKTEEINKKQAGKLSKRLFLIIIGMVLLIVSSDFLVQGLVDLAISLQVDPFLISLIGLSVGTNLPEITLAVKSVLLGRKDMAIGNYMGSATFNILILSVLGLASGGITVQSDFTVTLIISVVGLFLFWLFMITKSKLSRLEGLALFALYIAFLLMEIF